MLTKIERQKNARMPLFFPGVNMVQTVMENGLTALQFTIKLKETIGNTEADLLSQFTSTRKSKYNSGRNKDNCCSGIRGGSRGKRNRELED